MLVNVNIEKHNKQLQDIACAYLTQKRKYIFLFLAIYSYIPNRRAGTLINFRKIFVPTFSLFRATRLLEFQTFFKPTLFNKYGRLQKFLKTFLKKK